MYQPRYIISNAILKNIGIIEAAKEVIDHAPLLPYYEKQFQKDALVRTVHHGTHIEGNELNMTQTEKVVIGEDVVARERDIQEVINYRKVMDHIDELRVMNEPARLANESVAGRELRITEEIIQDIHKMTVANLLNEEKTGKYRETSVVVKNNRTGEVSFRPPPAAEVKPALTQLTAFMNDLNMKDIHPVLRSGIVHYEFVRIHPFVDGNGRVARAISTLLLFIEGYDIRKFFSLEEYFDTHADEYYESLQSVAKKDGDLTDWLSYFTKGLAIELTKIKERVEKISVDGKIRQKLGGKPLMLSDRQLAIIEYIQENGFLQNKMFPTLFPMISEDTVLNEIKVLLTARIIKKQGTTKGAKYIMG